VLLVPLQNILDAHTKLLKDYVWLVFNNALGVNFWKPFQILVRKVFHDFKLIVIHVIFSIHFDDYFPFFNFVKGKVNFTKATLADFLL
jgi:hypothetical protein